MIKKNAYLIEFSVNRMIVEAKSCSNADNVSKKSEEVKAFEFQLFCEHG